MKFTKGNESKEDYLKVVMDENADMNTACNILKKENTKLFSKWDRGDGSFANNNKCIARIL